MLFCRNTSQAFSYSLIKSSNEVNLAFDPVFLSHLVTTPALTNSSKSLADSTKSVPRSLWINEADAYLFEIANFAALSNKGSSFGSSLLITYLTLKKVVLLRPCESKIDHNKWLSQKQTIFCIENVEKALG